MSDRSIRGLYAIIDSNVVADDKLFTAAVQALQGGARILQYRNKQGDVERCYQQARTLRSVCDEHTAVLIINDDVELALRVAADGVHIGHDDADYQYCRQILGPAAIIGMSCYNQLDLALSSQQAGADYVAFGSFYPSATKPRAVRADLSLLTTARPQLDIPIVAIGGITIDNGAELIRLGADALAVINGLFNQPDITACAQHFDQLFNHNSAP